MTESSWLDSHETAEAYIREMAKHHWTRQDNLDAINHLRALSGDRPLTMQRYLRNNRLAEQDAPLIGEPRHLNFFQRVHHAWQAGRAAFKAAMRKNR